jgi:hypothetical protein
MPLPSRPRDPRSSPSWWVDMATGEVPNDKEQVLAALSEMEAAHRARQERQGKGCESDGATPGRSSTTCRRRPLGNVTNESRYGAYPPSGFRTIFYALPQ